MSTNRTADPTATQAPADPPDLQNFLIETLPSSGDGCTAASVAQAFKVVGDYIAWLQARFAQGSAWNQRLEVYRNALLQERHLIDHMGFPMGRLVKWTESWKGGDTQVGAGTVAFANTDRFWGVHVVAGGTGGRAKVIFDPSAAGLPVPILTNVLMLEVGSGASDLATANVGYTGMFSDDVAIAMETDVYPDVSQTNQVNYVVGLGDKFADDTSLVGGVFEKRAGDTNWFAVCGDGTALSARVDTGVAVTPNAWQKMRVEWHGANVADNTNAAMRFYIGTPGSAPVATINTHLPTGSATPRASLILGGKRTTGTAVTEAFFAPVQFAMNY